MSLAKKAFRGFVLNAASKLAEFGLSFAISIILTRSLGPELFGKYAIVMTFCGLFALLANFGFEDALNVLIPKDADDKTKQSAIFSTLLWLRVFSMVIIAGLAFLLAGPISAVMDNPGLADLIRIAIPFIFVANINALFMFLFTGLFRFGTLAVAKIVSLVFQLIGISIVFSLGGGVAEVIVVQFITSSVLFAIFFFTGRSYITWRVKKQILVPIISFSLAVWMTNLVNFVLGKQSDILLMSFFRVGEAGIGYYETAYRAVHTVNMLLISGFIGVTVASFAAVTNRDEKLLGEAWQLTVKAYAAIALPVILFSVVHARAIIVGVFSKNFLPAVIMFQVFASFMFFSKLFGGGNHISLLYATGRQKIAFAVRFAAGLANVTINLFLIPWFGPIGALIGTGTAQVAVVVTELVIVKRSVTVPFPVKFNAKLLLGCALGLIPGIVFFPRHLWSVALAGIAYYVIISAVLLALKPLGPRDVEMLAAVNPLLGNLASRLSRRYEETEVKANN